jgi:hypothetical protein
MYASQPGGDWVFRRRGYTPAENPHFLVSVIAASGEGIYPYGTLKNLEPTVEEIIDLLLTCCNAVGGKKPQYVSTDAETIVAPLREVSVRSEWRRGEQHSLSDNTVILS